MTDFILVLCTVDSNDSAKSIARNLVENKLAACVNIIPHITSVYEWNNEIVEDAEYLLVIKTKENLFEKLEEQIKKIHHYEVPEIISFKIENGSDRYLNWLNEVLNK